MAQKEETREPKEKSGPSPVRNTNQFAETQNSRTTNAFNDTVRASANSRTEKAIEQGQE